MSRIFVVEDQVIVSEDIAQTLRQLGYEIAGTAESGVEALLEIERTRPDLVLMDIQLAGRLDGIQITAAIRKRWAIPVIYLTAHSDEATLARAKETGPYGYLLKPFNERELRTAIEVALRRHALETQLAQRERWYATTLASVGDAVIATDPSGHITFMNPIAESLTGWSDADARSRPINEVFKIVSDGVPEAQIAVSQAIRDGFRAQLPLDAKLVGRNGAHVAVDDAIAPIVDTEGNLLGSVVVFRDITERRHLEGRLALAERLAAIATMAAGLAHELNNPLTAAIGNVDYAAKRLADLVDEARSSKAPSRLTQGLEEIADALEDARGAGARVRDIVRDLKKFSRAEQISKDIVELPSAIDAALLITRHLVRTGSSVTCQLGTTPLIEANEGQIVQVLANLISNAIQAGKGVRGHRVTISTRTDEEGRAVVEVKDSGPGIRLEDRARIFEPFFTTKPSGDGLGLGLSICQNIVASLGGDINVDSPPGSGAVFQVSLPPAGEQAGKLLKLRSVAPGAARRAKVLVIDDEEIVGRTIERVLSRFHDVHVEADARAAISRSKLDSFDVILCDVTMPQMSGPDVYHGISTIDSALAERIVFITGGSISPQVESFLESCANLVLHKPFSATQLLSTVASFVR
jgi:two-component system, cell cycle sensor histidine kinase and response regulator CckA